MADLLLEIGTEELPASYLDAAIEQLSSLAKDALAKARLAPAGAVAVTGTPRRIVVAVEGLPERQPDSDVESSGPPASAAFKDGKPTKAAEGFAARAGVKVDALVVRDTPKGPYVFAVTRVEGRSAIAVLADEVLPALVRSIVFPKSMTWVPGSKLRFARPVRRIVALFGREVVPFEWNRVRAGRATAGHPFLAPAPFELEDASYPRYRELLRERSVVVDRDERRRMIEDEVRAQGSRLPPRPALVATVANLVELPRLMTGELEARFLDIPHVVIVSAIETHLRGFPIFEGPGRVTNRFAFIANRPPDAVIREGNERVVRARLSDATFFYEQDQKTPLAELAPRLKEVVFQDKLGTVWDKQERVAELAGSVHVALGWTDKAPIERAARLMKADLLTQVVGEFPELQGEIGAVYARRQGEPDEVAAAIREAYLPRGEGDVLPETRTGLCLSIAEKLDNAACAFAVNMRPTGSKDPHGIRRQIIGILRMLRDKALAVRLSVLFEQACLRLPDEPFIPRKRPVLSKAEGDPKAPPPDLLQLRRELAWDLVEYAKARLVAMAVDERHRHDLVNAALAVGVDDVPDFWARLDALGELARHEEFPRLVELVERTRNITKKAEGLPAGVDPALLREPGEKALAEALGAARPVVQGLLDQRQYVQAGERTMDALARPVARFFDEVFVMDEDASVRMNRLTLLRDVHRLLAERFADLAEVARR